MVSEKWRAQLVPLSERARVPNLIAIFAAAGFATFTRHPAVTV